MAERSRKGASWPVRTCKIVTVVCLLGAGSAAAETRRQVGKRLEPLLRSSPIKVHSIYSRARGTINKDVWGVRIGRVKAIFRRPVSRQKAWDTIPVDGFAARELAVYRSALRLGLERVVPTTVPREVKGERGTLQHWVPGTTKRFASLLDQESLKLIVRHPRRPRDRAKQRQIRRRLARLAQQVSWDSVHEMLILDYIVQQADRQSDNIVFQRRPNQKALVYAIDNEISFAPFWLNTVLQFDGHALGLFGAEVFGKTRLSTRVQERLKSVDVPRWVAELRRMGIPEARIRIAVNRLERVNESGLRAVYGNPVLSGWNGMLLARARELFGAPPN